MPYRRKMENNYLITQEQINTILKYMFVVQHISLLTKLPKLDPKIKPDFVKQESKRK